jgi:hypothetical protein
MPTLAQRRLAHQFLAAPTLPDAVAVVRALGAVQAQDYGSALWAVAQRTRHLVATDVETAVARGRILRTHVLRPTWHFILPEDARWMLELTGPRVRQAMAPYHRKWGIDARERRKSHAALERALRDGAQLTRAELSAALRRAGITVAAGERVGHLLLEAEIARVIISGARRGKQLTYALFDARVPAAPTRDRDDALDDLTRRYFTTRGPATLQDFAWWSGLTVADAKRGVAIAARALQREQLEGTSYWQARQAPNPRHWTPIAHLLPNYDELFIGFKDRSGFEERLRGMRTRQRLNALRGHPLFIDGQVVGGWRRALAKTVEVKLNLLVPVSALERRLVQRAAQRYGKFAGLPVTVRF